MLSIINKICYTIAFIPSIYSAFGQLITAPEPEYIGNVVFAKGNQTIELEKQKASVSSSSGLAIYTGGIKENLKIKGSFSPINFKGEKLNFIVKVNDNSIDPFELIQIYRFGINADSRKLIISNTSFGGTKEGNLERIKFSAKKYGEKSFLITLTDYPYGEYGINVNISNINDSKANGVTFHLFSVHPKEGDLVAYKVQGIVTNHEDIWHGLVKELTNKDAILQTSNKGVDFTEKVAIEKLTAVKEIEFPILTDKIQRDTLFGIISYNDKVRLLGYQPSFDAIYLGTFNQKIAVLTSEYGKPSLKKVEFNEKKRINKLEKDSFSSYLDEYRNRYEQSLKTNNSVEQKTNLEQVDDSTSLNLKLSSEANTKIIEAKKNDIPNLGDNVFWKDDKQTRFQGKLISVEDGIALVSIMLNGKQIKKMVVFDRLKKQF